MQAEHLPLGYLPTVLLQRCQDLRPSAAVDVLQLEYHAAVWRGQAVDEAQHVQFGVGVHGALVVVQGGKSGLIGAHPVGRALGMVGIGIAESIASADEVKAAIEHQQANEEPQNPLQRAQEQLVAAEKQYCAARGIESWGDFHREQIMTRQDYANTVESLTAIAAELIAES